MTASESTAARATDLTILIADDHWVVRESLRQVATSLQADVRTVEAATFQEALQMLESNPDINLLLFDLVMPGFSEFDGLRVIRRKHPAVPVVIVSIHEDPDYVLRAIQHGVIGYIPKSANADEIKRALELVVAGGVSFPREIIARARPDDTHADARPIAGADARLSSLTPRESRILGLLGRGSSVLDIAEALDISRQTVRVHLGNAMKKLDVSTRESAIRFAVENETALDAQAASSDSDGTARRGASRTPASRS
ncbi:response regulator transcription factor [Labrys monachus]|uniref:DNA-binding NarL/FixJ family response regulator n=1 Tax=Labrys monachus TaxID=217067 RepID=A0ABU0FND2_9HYPH|nr:response regulator transcription factor [Labrys monachus]MDQ0396127.1 DNA-binding NarL/FixJ family response regulator [Labrys monachus]